MSSITNFILLLFPTIFLSIFESKSLFPKPSQCVKSRKCSKLLAQIVHKPETCALKYFDNISVTLKERSEILFNPNADSFIYSFENTYNVLVILVDALGNTMNYYPNQTKSSGPPVMYTDTAQSYLNFPGFVRQVSDQKFYYTFNVFSNKAEHYEVTLSMPLSKDPIFC